jgi:hypothetical protein
LKERKAIYREGLGAMLVDADFDETTPYDVPKEPKLFQSYFPYGNQESKDTVFSSVDYAKLNSAVANAFDIGAKDKRTRSVIVYKDRIIAEKYDTGFDKDSKIWVGR